MTIDSKCVLTFCGNISYQNYQQIMLKRNWISMKMIFFQILCLWHVNRNEVTKWRNDEFLNFHETYFLKYKTETAKTVQRQLHILHNISSFRHFVISSLHFYWHAKDIKDRNSKYIQVFNLNVAFYYLDFYSKRSNKFLRGF